MDFTLTDMAPIERYRLLVGAVVPRPIAFISSLSPEGVPNAAPFSFFNLFGADPAIVVLGFNTRPDGPKDSYRNIVERGEFVINIVTYDLAKRMNACSAEVAGDIDEFTLSGLTPSPSVLVAAPRIAESPVHLECRFTQIVTVAPGRALVLGEVLHVHVEDSMLVNNAAIDQQKLDVVAKMGGNWYGRATDMFEMVRP